MTSFRGLLKYFTVAACVLCSVKTVSAASDSGFKNRTTVLLAGDSIMEQATEPSVDGFISLLAGRYSRSADMIVRALSGYNTRWYLKYAMPGIEEEITRGDYNPALITLWLGANDAVRCTSPFHSTSKNLIKIVEKFQAVAPDSKMMMVTPTHVGDAARKKFAAERTDSKKGLLDRSNAMMKPYARACVEAAKEAGVSVLDLYSHFDAMTVTARDKLLVDGVHFNAAGHLVVDEKLRATILKEFPEVNDLLDTYQFPIVSRWMKDDPYVPETTK
ncbi:GDSL-like Lipase/Acylhydrolase family [Phytophthora infestans]|uniref:GDSL-like Lipase/Acylhydrolase family n=1 Tax=Phytophthora infestans TaxID=4787 RepID=A0A8S9U6G2_PHYIN|nr:GDSL-like Lipase/Acylhydrolase family [Phytophthora infestans]